MEESKFKRNVELFKIRFASVYDCIVYAQKS